jgi:predicted metal-binding protein
MKPAIIVCETCSYSKTQQEWNGRRGGELLLEAVERLAAKLPGRDRFEVRPTRCLMACERHCNVHLRALEKICYVIGDLSPDEKGAAIILDYFLKYLESETGSVKYRSWPEGIKGRFIARIPPFVIKS